jgi:undecaprenyl-diphosphatase
MREALVAIDAALLGGVLELPHPDWLNSIMVAASRVGTAGAIWLVLAATLVILRKIRWQDLARLTLAIVLAYVVVDLALKPWIDRPRPALTPALVFATVPETRSFPSGHAASAVAAALVLTRAWRRGRAFIWTIAALVAVSRVYLGVHYPLDVLGGCATGFACGWIALRVEPSSMPRPPG